MLTISIVEEANGKVSLSNGSGSFPIPEVTLWNDPLRSHAHYIARHMSWVWVCDNDHLVRIEPESLTPSGIFFSARCKTMDYVRETDGGLMVLSQSGTFYVNYLGEFHLLKSVPPIQIVPQLPITIVPPTVFWHNANSVCMGTNLDSGVTIPETFPGITSKSVALG